MHCRALGTGVAQGHVPLQYFEQLVAMFPHIFSKPWVRVNLCPSNILRLPTALQGFFFYPIGQDRVSIVKSSLDLFLNITKNFTFLGFFFLKVNKLYLKKNPTMRLLQTTSLSFWIFDSTLHAYYIKDHMFIRDQKVKNWCHTN